MKGFPNEIVDSGVVGGFLEAWVCAAAIPLLILDRSSNSLPSNVLAALSAYCDRTFTPSFFSAFFRLQQEQLQLSSRVKLVICAWLKPPTQLHQFR